MRFLFLMIGFVVSMIKFSGTEFFSYDSYRIYRIFFDYREQYKEFLKINENDDDEYEILFDKASNPYSAEITVPPEKLPKFLNFVAKNNFKYKLEIQNMQRLIDDERNRINIRQGSKFDWNSYYPLPHVYAWLEELEKQHKNFKLITVGKSFEGRNITGIQINNGKNLPGVVIESGIHAREWITIAGTSWIINEILKSNEMIWKQFNWLYFPCYNPDGYVYSWRKERLWRKTRSVHKAVSKICYGVDGNRNWDSDWGGLGSSGNPCSLAYRGPKVFSEPETKAISRYLKRAAKRSNNKIYISYHSYGQLLEFPYGYTGKRAPFYNIWNRIAKNAGEAYTKVHKEKIKIGQMFAPEYIVSGDSTDWYYEKLNASISFLYEMRDRGKYKFILPPEEIIPVGQEHLASLRVVLQEYQKFFGTGL